MRSKLTLQQISEFLSEYWNLVKTEGDIVDQCIELVEKYQDGFVTDMLMVLLKYTTTDSTIAKIKNLSLITDWQKLVDTADVLVELHPEYQDLIIHKIAQIERRARKNA